MTENEQIAAYVKALARDLNHPLVVPKWLADELKKRGVTEGYLETPQLISQ